MTIRPFGLSAFVRIQTGINDGLRITSGTAGTFTVTLTPGLYSGGFGASNPASSNDLSAYGFTSLLQHLEARVLAVAGVAWRFALQTEYVGSSGIAASPTGHIFIRGTHASDQVDWNHAGTTVDPDWFGIGDVTVDSDLSASYVDVSSFSSSLAFVSHRTIRSEFHDEEYPDAVARSDSGKQWWRTGTAVIRRDLSIAASGLQRTVNTTHQALRKFLSGLRQNGAGRRFHFFPNLALLNWGNWDPDGLTDATLFGQQDLCLDGQRAPLTWAPRFRFDNYAKEWAVDVPCIEYIS